MGIWTVDTFRWAWKVVVYEGTGMVVRRTGRTKVGWDSRGRIWALLLPALLWCSGCLALEGYFGEG